jgi:hypothetical protein
MNLRRICALVILYILVPSHGFAGSHSEHLDSALTVAVGGLGRSRRPAGGTWAAGAHTFAYSLSYRRQIDRRFSAQFTYINQGHYDDHGHYDDEYGLPVRPSNHSRDDLQLELYAGVRPADGPVHLRLGTGVAYYSETDNRRGPPDFQNYQGIGWVVSANAEFDITARWFIGGSLHRHFVVNRYDSTNALFGLGFRLPTSGRESATIAGAAGTDAPANGRMRHAVRVSYGKGILNASNSETLKPALQFAYEAGFSDHFAVSASYLDEGRGPKLRRRGVAVQGEVRQPMGAFLTIGAGLGPYVNVDQAPYFGRQGETSIDALVTLFLEIRLTRRVELLVSANRPRALNNLKDKPMTDVLQTGFKFQL